MSSKRKTMLAAAGAVASLALAGSAAGHQGHDGHHGSGNDDVLSGDVRFYVERDSNPLRQADTWAAQGRKQDAKLMRALGHQPQAVWFSKGTPAEVRQGVRQTMIAAARQRAVPVLVAYYIPARDCSQYSAGGAPDEASYKAWIDAFARGIGGGKAVVILEPDGLALLSSEPWCTIGGGGDPSSPEDFSLVEERFREINGAIDRLERNPRTAVYIDAGHSAWQQINDYDAGYGEPRQQMGIVSRLLKGGVDKAQGFFLNVSNYRNNAELVDYGTRVSKCIAFRQRTGAASCTDDEIASVRVNSRTLTHFVLDTSRNGLGHWTPPAGKYAGDPQDWCNPPGRALGLRPTTRVGHPLIDALLWVKRPGESDGQCTRGTAGPEDPEYGIVDPAAGEWWPDYALGLAQRAVPPLH